MGLPIQDFERKFLGIGPSNGDFLKKVWGIIIICTPRFSLIKRKQRVIYLNALSEAEIISWEFFFKVVIAF